MNISQLQETSAKSYVGDRLYFHKNYGFMIVGFFENWKDIFWLEEEEEHGYYYLVSAPYDDEGNIDFDKKQDVDEWYGIHEFQKGSIQDEDRRISEIWSISNDLLNITYRYQIQNLKNLVKI